MSHSESLDKIIPALIAFQAEMEPVEKDDTNPHFSHKFTSLGAIIKATRELRKKHGLAVTNTMSVLPDGSSGMITTLWHVSGQWISGEMPLLLAKDDPQAQGSAITYARRYATSAILDLAQADDDGNQGTQSRQGYQSNRGSAPARSRQEAAPACPSCGSVESTGKSIKGDGFYCFPKRGGCGRAFNAEEGEPDPRSEQDKELDAMFS